MSPNETVDCDDVYFTRQLYTVEPIYGSKRVLQKDVLALASKAYSRFRMAVRQADGFIDAADVPSVTITSVEDSDGKAWEASVECGSQCFRYTNWGGEEFDIVFE